MNQAGEKQRFNQAEYTEPDPFIGTPKKDNLIGMSPPNLYFFLKLISGVKIV